MAAHEAPRRSLPVFELGTPESDGVYIEAQPPLTCSATLGGTRIGWVLVVAVSPAQFECALDLFSDIHSHGASATLCNQAWRGFDVFRRDRVVFDVIARMVRLKEWARCFCASPVESTEENYKNRYVFANAVQEGSGWRATIGCTASQTPHGFGDAADGAWKCCAAKQETERGCPSCGSNRARIGCIAACLQAHKKMIWCKRCLITAYCSAECRDNSAEEHARVCESFAEAAKADGLGRVCFFCGTPEAAGTLSLKRCNRCEAAFYCSAECQRRDWRAGHKLDCVQVQGSQGLGARSSSSSARRDSRAASDSPARADERVASAQRSLDVKRAAMVQQFESLKATGCHWEGMDPSNPEQLLIVSETTRVAQAQKELIESGTVVHDLRIGSKVLVHSLTGATQHNHTRGQVTALPGEGEARYSIFMESSRERIRVRGRNLCDTTDLHSALGLLQISTPLLQTTRVPTG